MWQAGRGNWLPRLERHQERWRSLGRIQAAIAYQAARGRLTPADAEYYGRHPVRWTWREARRAGRKLAMAAPAVAVRLGSVLRTIDPRLVLSNVWQFVSSQEHRTGIAQTYVRSRITRWQARGQLGAEDARALREELDATESTSYLTDFGAHLGMKATFQLLEFAIIGALAGAGVIGVVWIAVIVALDGLIYRSTYTSYRSVGAAARRQPLPWVALAVGLVPLLGSLAYPAQMVHSARERRECVGRFIIYDTLTRLGTRLPIWGGADTLTEHWFNRLAHRVARPRP